MHEWIDELIGEEIHTCIHIHAYVHIDGGKNAYIHVCMHALMN